GGRGVGEQVGHGGGGGVAVRYHRPIAAVGHRHRHRGVPVAELPRVGEVDVFLIPQRAPHPIVVDVGGESRGERGAQAQPRGGDGEVRDPAGGRTHPLGPHFLAGRGRGGEAGEYDVEEQHPGQQHVVGERLVFPRGGGAVGVFGRPVHLGEGGVLGNVFVRPGGHRAIVSG